LLYIQLEAIYMANLMRLVNVFFIRDLGPSISSIVDAKAVECAPWDAELRNVRDWSWLFRRFRSAKMCCPMFHWADIAKCTIRSDQLQEFSRRSLSIRSRIAFVIDRTSASSAQWNIGKWIPADWKSHIHTGTLPRFRFVHSF